MSTQGALLFDDSFIEDCRMSMVPDHVLELGRCPCGRIAKLSGGLCSSCAEPLSEQDGDTGD